MAHDRFVKFSPENQPSREQLLEIVTNFLGGCGQILEDNYRRWTIDLPGVPTSPFKGLPGARPQTYENRWIEVILSWEDKALVVDVLTRQQDDFTNALADRLAALLVRYYQAELDDN